MGRHSKSKLLVMAVLLLVFAILASACGRSQFVSELNPADEPRSNVAVTGSGSESQSPAEMPEAVSAPAASDPQIQEPSVSFELQTELGAAGMIFVGVGGDIDGVQNPTLQVAEGEVVQITLINGDGMEHDVAIPDLGAHSEHISSKGSSTTFTFTADQAGSFAYYCTVPGHRQAGMEGLFIVGEDTPETAAATAPSIVLDPSDLPPPIGERPAQTITMEIETIEVEGQLADGTTFTYWTFDGTIPGPFLRVKVGDTVELTLKNRADSSMTHSIDLHAVTGPGGGAAVTQVPPGEAKSFTFKAINPGLYVYHCATPMVAHHIANGMYGMILVEPEEGLPEVDREFYVMQGEIYTQAPFGEPGLQEISIEKLLDEKPEYFVFNGAVGALTAEYPMTAEVGETVRIYFGVGGPNFTSSFHVIGEIFDRVYDQGSITAAPLTDVQTTLVPAGGATVVDFTLEVPGRYILVDHALSRLERGLAGFLLVEGEENMEVFHSDEEISGGH